MQKWLQNISISKKLGSIVLLVSLVMLFSVGAFVASISFLNNEFEKFENESFEGVKSVLEIEKELNYFSRVTREIMLGSDIGSNLSNLTQTSKKIESLFIKLESSSNSDSQKALILKSKQDMLSFISMSQNLMLEAKSSSVNLQELYKRYHTEISPYAVSSREAFKKLESAKMQEATLSKKAFKEDITLLRSVSISSSIIILIFIIMLMQTIISQIKKSLSSVKDGLLSFFDFLCSKQKNASTLADLGTDEFGELAKAINGNIMYIEKKFLEQQQSVVDFNLICDYAAKGFLYHRISTTYEDTNLNALSASLNAMLDEVEKTFQNTVTVMISMAKGDYVEYDSSSNAASGSFASMLNSIRAIRTSNSELFAMIARFSKQFNKDASELSNSGDELSSRANEQASNLEETAAAIEELTSNVAANVEKTQDMTKIAQEAKNAAEQGSGIAKKNLGAMNEIVNATEAIAQAVGIIENIAFQTNILSLNAAVEAATAGEAGKGFAVVAQEVRNLASRSAEAAKQIQELSLAARQKSQDGLKTTQNMMDSFSLITHKIIQTDESVRDVANASREQMDGINQINSAVSQLDQMTQLNAKTANNVAQIANEILHKTTQFEDMLTNIKYDKKYDDSSCDVNLLFMTTKLKLDHINFKDNNYAKLKSNKTPWKVVSHHECALGKWIDANADTPFAKTKEWQKLLKEHEHVHQGVQTLINEDLSNAPKETIFALSQEIEKATSEVFAGLDGAKLVNCGTIKKEVKF